MAPVLVKSLNRLNRASLIDLALQWLQQQQSCQPYLSSNRNVSESDEEDYLYPPADDVDALRDIYHLLRKDEKDVSKRDVIDRIVDGDWRRGLSLHQLAMIDFAYLEHNDTALKWSALRLVPLDYGYGEKDSQPSRKRRKLCHAPSQPQYPYITPATFVTSLKSEISPMVKAHYHLHRLPPPSKLSILRLYISPQTPFAPKKSSIPRNAGQAADSRRIMYIALPDSCPYVYISLSGATGSHASGQRDAKGKVPAMVDMAAMKRIILEAIPKAMSRPQQRWALESTKLTAKSLHSMSKLRGNGRPGTAGGAYSGFVAQDDDGMDQSPADVTQHAEFQKEEPQRRLDARFGTMRGAHHAALDRFHVKLEDVTKPQGEGRVADDAAPLTLSLSGSDVFLGLRKLAELGSEYIDLQKMPAWMTGEMGVSSLTV